jgi:spore coat protein CotH
MRAKTVVARMYPLSSGLCLGIFLLLCLTGCARSDHEEKSFETGDEELALEAEREVVESESDLEPEDSDPVEWPQFTLPRGCCEIYSQDFVPVFEIKIAQEDWEALFYAYQHPKEVDDPKSYHPLIEFKYKDIIIRDAMIRLRGNSLHWWPDPKIQFNISFNQINNKGRFLGLRKINLDVAHNDSSLFHDRLAASIFRDLELPAPCVNHAKLYINGEFFGLYVNIEHVDQEFLQRNFGHHDEGNLYKSRPHHIFDKQTNESDPDRSDIERFQEELTLEELDALIDLDQAVQEWAAEAIIPHLDGYFVGGTNYQVYNHPERGFIFIPWDLDFGPAEGDLISYTVSWGQGKPYHMPTLLENERWFGIYLEAVEKALAAFDPEMLTQRIDT